MQADAELKSVLFPPVENNKTKKIQKFVFLSFACYTEERTKFKSISMEQNTLEGTWEEILQHSAKLAGQRVRLTILPNQSSNSSTPETLDQKLKGRVGRVYFQPSDLSERVEEVFTNILDVQD